MTESTVERPSRIRVEVFIRPHTSTDVVELLRELVARARRLEERETVADVRVKTWAAVRPALEELSDSGPSVSITVDSFQAWADREGYELEPGFERRETASLLSRRPAAEIRVPTACLAVYADDTLEWVVPCTDGERTYTVDECLSALERDADPFDGRTDPSKAGSDRASGEQAEPENGA